MNNAVKIFTFSQIPVYVKYWFLILFLFLPYFEVFSIFIGVLIHELAHAIEAKKLGYKTDYVFIDVLYGGALVDSSYRFDNKNAIKIAIAGPVANIALGGIIFGLSSVIYHFLGDIYSFLEYSSKFMMINLLLGFLNLIPIYPLDGGRISKAILNLFFNRRKARKINSIVSSIISLFLIIIGFFYSSWFIVIFSFIFLFTAYTEWKK
jgi:Zn-dependent protease